MTKEKFRTKLKRNWKNILIGILIYCLISFIYGHYQFVEQTKDYMNEYELNVTRMVSEYQLNVTKSLGDYGSTHDCFERGTMECYEKGTVNCYEK